MQLSNEATFFQSEDSTIVVFGGRWIEPLLYSFDGQTFFELKVTGSDRTSKNFKLVRATFHYEDPHHGLKGVMNYKDDELQWNGMTFRKTSGLSEINTVSLPTIRKPEYLFRLPDGTHLYVSVDKYCYSYESFKLFLGSTDNLREIPVQDVQRYRDGGTTFVKTAKGVLFSPSPFNKRAKAMWNEFVLEKLDPDMYRITETENSVRVQLAEL